MMKDAGSLSVRGLLDASIVESFMKLSGFTSVETNGKDEVRGKRVEWKATGAPLKRKE